MRPARPYPLLASLLLSLAAATAQDPAVPPGGFAIDETNVDRIVAWSDSYRTLMDVRFPAVAAPPGGWPCAVLFHGSGRSRHGKRAFARVLASRGYLSVAFDLRTHGATPTLNPTAPTQFPFERLLLDSAEVVYLARQLAGPRLDPARVGMDGTSLGGTNSFRAAAWSGLALPLAGYVTHFPRLSAAATQITPIDRLESEVPGGLLLRNHAAETLAEDRTSAAWVAAVAGRYDVVHSIWSGRPFAQWYPMLQQSDVPLLARMGYDDWRVAPGASLDALQTLRPGVPIKGVAFGNGHGTPDHPAEAAVTRDLIVRWFDHFLKGAANGVLAEPAFEATLLPYDPVAYANGAERPARFRAAWPPAPPATTLHLRGGGALTAQAPAAVEPGPVLRHRVAPGYDLPAFVDRDRIAKVPATVASVLQSIPLVSAEFVGPPLAGEAELFGRPQVGLSIRASTGDFQISASLWVRSAAVPDRFLAGGTTAVRGQQPGQHQVRFALRDVATIVPAGARLVVRVENLSLFLAPGQTVIEYVPWFHDVDLAVEIGPQTPAAIHLPIQPVPGVGMTPRLATVRAAAGFDHELAIDGGPARAGQPYFAVMSGSGFGPGFALGPGWDQWLPLNPDVFTLAGLDLLNTPILPAFAGVLDASGTAAPHVRMPAFLANLLVGRRLTFAAIAGPANALVAGGPAELDIDP